MNISLKHTMQYIIILFVFLISSVTHSAPIPKPPNAKNVKSYVLMDYDSGMIIASKNPQVWHNIRVDAHSNAIFELENIYKKTIESANKLNAFYNGAIEVKPFYWRKILKD